MKRILVLIVLLIFLAPLIAAPEGEVVTEEKLYELSDDDLEKALEKPETYVNIDVSKLLDGFSAESKDKVYGMIRWEMVDFNKITEPEKIDFTKVNLDNDAMWDKIKLITNVENKNAVYRKILRDKELSKELSNKFDFSSGNAKITQDGRIISGTGNKIIMSVQELKEYGNAFTSIKSTETGFELGDLNGNTFFEPGPSAKSVELKLTSSGNKLIYDFNGKKITHNPTKIAGIIAHNDRTEIVYKKSETEYGYAVDFYGNNIDVNDYGTTTVDGVTMHFLDISGVRSVEVTENEDGSKNLVYVYNIGDNYQGRTIKNADSITNLQIKINNDASAIILGSVTGEKPLDYEGHILNPGTNTFFIQLDTDKNLMGLLTHELAAGSEIKKNNNEKITIQNNVADFDVIYHGDDMVIYSAENAQIKDSEIGQTFTFGKKGDMLYTHNDKGKTTGVHVSTVVKSSTDQGKVSGEENKYLTPNINGDNYDIVFSGDEANKLVGYYHGNPVRISLDGTNVFNGADINALNGPLILDNTYTPEKLGNILSNNFPNYETLKANPAIARDYYIALENGKYAPARNVDIQNPQDYSLAFVSKGTLNLPDREDLKRIENSITALDEEIEKLTANAKEKEILFPVDDVRLGKLKLDKSQLEKSYNEKLEKLETTIIRDTDDIMKFLPTEKATVNFNTDNYMYSSLKDTENTNNPFYLSDAFKIKHNTFSTALYTDEEPMVESTKLLNTGFEVTETSKGTVVTDGNYYYFYNAETKKWQHQSGDTLYDMQKEDVIDAKTAASLEFVSNKNGYKDPKYYLEPDTSSPEVKELNAKEFTFKSSSDTYAEISIQGSSSETADVIISPGLDGKSEIKTSISGSYGYHKYESESFSGLNNRKIRNSLMDLASTLTKESTPDSLGYHTIDLGSEKIEIDVGDQKLTFKGKIEVLNNEKENYMVIKDETHTIVVGKNSLAVDDNKEAHISYKNEDGVMVEKDISLESIKGFDKFKNYDEITSPGFVIEHGSDATSSIKVDYTPEKVKVTSPPSGEAGEQSSTKKVLGGKAVSVEEGEAIVYLDGTEAKVKQVTDNGKTFLEIKQPNGKTPIYEVDGDKYKYVRLLDEDGNDISSSDKTIGEIYVNMEGSKNKARFDAATKATQNGQTKTELAGTGPKVTEVTDNEDKTKLADDITNLENEIYWLEISPNAYKPAFKNEIEQKKSELSQLRNKEKAIAEEGGKGDVGVVAEVVSKFVKNDYKMSRAIDEYYDIISYASIEKGISLHAFKKLGEDEMQTVRYVGKDGRQIDYNIKTGKYTLRTQGYNTPLEDGWLSTEEKSIINGLVSDLEKDGLISTNTASGAAEPTSTDNTAKTEAQAQIEKTEKVREQVSGVSNSGIKDFYSVYNSDSDFTHSTMVFNNGAEYTVGRINKQVEFVMIQTPGMEKEKSYFYRNNQWTYYNEDEDRFLVLPDTDPNHGALNTIRNEGS